MDLNFLLHRHQLSLMLAERAPSSRERRVHGQFAREFAEQSRRPATRSAPAAACGIRNVIPPGRGGAPTPAPATSKAFAATARRRRKSRPSSRGAESDVLRHAWEHFGAAGRSSPSSTPATAGFQGQPLQVALQSDEGLMRVELLLTTMTLEA